MKLERGEAHADTPHQAPITALFVGGFRETTVDGAVGGSLIAARSLVSSKLSRHVHWVLLDTTMRSVPGPPLPIRALRAARRMARFTWIVSRPTTDVVLIFAGARWGFLEKGVMALVARTAGKPVLFSPRAGPMREDLAQSPALRSFARFVLSRCDRLICQGETWRRFYQDLTDLPSERVVSVPNWVTLEDYAKGERLRTNPTKKVTFLYLGWVERTKGIFDLVRAVDRYRGSLEGAQFVVCGRGGALADAERLVRERGVGDMFSFRGWVHGEEKWAVLASSHALVLPSYVEGMPNALLEGMAASLPVIASRVGAIPDVVEDGRTGLLIEPGDIEALGAALVRLAGDPDERLRLGRAGREAVAREHDIESAWPRILHAMRGALNDRRSAART